MYPASRVSPLLSTVPPPTAPSKVGDNFFPCELPEEASSALAEAVSACKEDAALFEGGEEAETLSRDALEGLVSAACEAGPVEGKGAVAVRAAAAAVRKSFVDALAEEKEKVRGVS